MPVHYTTQALFEASTVTGTSNNQSSALANYTNPLRGKHGLCDSINQSSAFCKLHQPLFEVSMVSVTQLTKAPRFTIYTSPLRGKHSLCDFNQLKLRTLQATQALLGASTPRILPNFS